MLLAIDTSAIISLGPFSLSSDGVTPSSSQTDMTVTLSKNGAVYVDSTTVNVTASTNNNGMFLVELTALDINTLGILDITVHNTTHLPVFDRYQIVPSNVYKTLVLGTTELIVDNSTQPVEGGQTVQGFQRLVLSVLAGKSTGGGSTNVSFISTTGGVARVNADVDNNGNRFNVTLVTSS